MRAVILLSGSGAGRATAAELGASVMKRLAIGFSVILAGLTIAPAPAPAGTTGALYDMNRFLNETHPFDTAQPPAQPAVPAPAPPVPTRPVTQAPPAARPAPLPSVDERADEGGYGILSEIRLGAFAHDQGPFSHQKEGGVDANLEALFVSPDFFGPIFSPRPHVGISANTSGDTSQVYLGLTWEWEFLENAFFDFAWGGAVHDGENAEVDPEKKALGCSVLFREAIDIGYRFQGKHGVMVHLDHISNAKLCKKNEGLESVGVRYGYRF